MTKRIRVTLLNGTKRTSQDSASSKYFFLDWWRYFRFIDPSPASTYNSMSISHTAKIQDPTSPADRVVRCVFCCAWCEQKASVLPCNASSSPTWLSGHSCSYNPTKLMPGYVNGKKFRSSQNRVAGSEVACQSSSFRLWPLPRPDGSLGKRAGKNKEWTEPYPWKTVGHHNPDHSQPWDTTHLRDLRRWHAKQWEKEKNKDQNK